jgi:two-component system, OmpR family, sensor kinase
MPIPGRRAFAAPRSAAAGLRGFYGRTPLRFKLVAAVLVLVLVALAGSGVVARTTMDRYLIGRVDAQLTSAVQPIVDHSGRGGHAGDNDGDARDDRLPSAYVVETIDATGAITSGPTSNLVDPGQPLPDLPRLTGAQSKASGTRTFTVRAVHGGGQWRVLAKPTTASDGSTGTLLVAQSLGDVNSTLNHLTIVLVVIGAVALVVIAGVGYVVVRTSLRPLRAVEHTAAQIAAGDLTHRVPDGDPRTEVGQLSGAINTMLSEIETAFAQRADSERAARSSEERMRVSEVAARSSEERMRAFVADASHELRTPLTTIRGFAELYRQGAASDASDIRRLMSRIEGEATRMGVLVEDLLLLARMDQQRPLARDPVDLLALAGDAVHDAAAVSPDREVRLEVGSTDPPPVVSGDEARLRQVLGNLVANALTHTPAGTSVTVRVATVRPGTEADVQTPAVVVLTVTDDGPGLTEEAAARVFERFYRVDAARSRSDGGTGLGLSIVAALVAGHGGSVDVDTAPGHGASFRVRLPLAEIAAAPV